MTRARRTTGGAVAQHGVGRCKLCWICVYSDDEGEGGILCGIGEIRWNLLEQRRRGDSLTLRILVIARDRGPIPEFFGSAKRPYRVTTSSLRARNRGTTTSPIELLLLTRSLKFSLASTASIFSPGCGAALRVGYVGVVGSRPAVRMSDATHRPQMTSQ